MESRPELWPAFKVVTQIQYPTISVIIKVWLWNENDSCRFGASEEVASGGKAGFALPIIGFAVESALLLHYSAQRQRMIASRHAG